ncbi:uncharacterized protein [Rhodnius prolixus]|uniref:uncharacterized protein n=1 Tax=Rhodnius prolixus TaxID=13249 RepID=UPI003D18ECD2
MPLISEIAQYIELAIQNSTQIYSQYNPLIHNMSTTSTSFKSTTQTKVELCDHLNTQRRPPRMVAASACQFGELTASITGWSFVHSTQYLLVHMHVQVHIQGVHGGEIETSSEGYSTAQMQQKLFYSLGPDSQ